MTDVSVDDSAVNAKGAQDFGWTTVHLVEPSLPLPEQQASKHQIRELEELRALFPEFFKSSDHDAEAAGG